MALSPSRSQDHHTPSPDRLITPSKSFRPSALWTTTAPTPVGVRVGEASSRRSPPRLHAMRTPVPVAHTWSATTADFMASYLRRQGIDSFTKSNLDRCAYGSALGGASVFVEADQRLEAELELVLLEEARVDTDDQDVAARTTRRAWIRLGSYLVLIGMVVGTVVPSVAIIWTRLLG